MVFYILLAGSIILCEAFMGNLVVINIEGIGNNNNDDWNTWFLAG